MKFFLKFSFVVVMLVGTISCQNDDKVQFNEDQIDLTNMNIQMKSLGDFSILFEYSDMDDLRSKADEATISMIRDAQDELASRTDITDIIATVETGNGISRITEIYFVDLPNDRIVEWSIFDETSGTYTTFSNGQDAITVLRLNGQCPPGYYLIKACSNTSDDLNTCLSNAVQQHLTNNLQGLGDCAGFRVHVAAANTVVCGKNC